MAHVPPSEPHASSAIPGTHVVPEQHPPWQIVSVAPPHDVEHVPVDVSHASPDGQSFAATHAALASPPVDEPLSITAESFASSEPSDELASPGDDPDELEPLDPPEDPDELELVDPPEDPLGELASVEASLLDVSRPALELLEQPTNARTAMPTPPAIRKPMLRMDSFPLTAFFVHARGTRLGHVRLGGVPELTREPGRRHRDARGSGP
jgi:hypothetical protein